MATKIRLQRRGRKGYAFYSIVAADVRAPRDGKFIEKIGTYNPNTNPATVDLNFERALYWVEVGAQPTDTVRSILSKEGVMLMKHLNVVFAKTLSMRQLLRPSLKLGRTRRTLRLLLSPTKRLQTRKPLLKLASLLKRK